MKIFTSEKIWQKPSLGVNARKYAPQTCLPSSQLLLPFLPGQLYLIKFMGLPTVSTVTSRSENSVTWWGGTLSVEEFNSRVICYLGYRASLFGCWLPWADVEPTLLINDLPRTIANDAKFWTVEHDPLDSHVTGAC